MEERCQQSLPTKYAGIPAREAIPVLPSYMEDHLFNSLDQTLRHFFYLEFKKPAPGELNPIVYSKFGKQNYDSEEKFCAETFTHSVRKCNLKKLFKGEPGDINLP